MQGVVLQEISDADLVRRVAEGAEVGSSGEAALRELLERHGGSVMAMARRMLGSREEAEEVLQDTFLKLHRHAHAFEEARASLRTYLFAIARNQALSRLRGRRARPAKAVDADPHAVAFQAAVGQEDDPLPRIVVRDALARLDDDERALLDGAFYQGFSHSELAERFDLPLGTVKSRVRRALHKLRGMLDEGVA